MAAAVATPKSADRPPRSADDSAPPPAAAKPSNQQAVQRAVRAVSSTGGNRHLHLLGAAMGPFLSPRGNRGGAAGASPRLRSISPRTLSTYTLSPFGIKATAGLQGSEGSSASRVAVAGSQTARGSQQQGSHTSSELRYVHQMLTTSPQHSARTTTTTRPVPRLPGGAGVGSLRPTSSTGAVAAQKMTTAPVVRPGVLPRTPTSSEPGAASCVGGSDEQLSSSTSRSSISSNPDPRQSVKKTANPARAKKASSTSAGGTPAPITVENKVGDAVKKLASSSGINPSPSPSSDEPRSREKPLHPVPTAQGITLGVGSAHQSPRSARQALTWTTAQRPARGTSPGFNIFSPAGFGQLCGGTRLVYNYGSQLSPQLASRGSDNPAWTTAVGTTMAPMKLTMQKSPYRAGGAAAEAEPPGGAAGAPPTSTVRREIAAIGAPVVPRGTTTSANEPPSTTVTDRGRARQASPRAKTAADVSSATTALATGDGPRDPDPTAAAPGTTTAGGAPSREGTAPALTSSRSYKTTRPPQAPGGFVASILAPPTTIGSMSRNMSQQPDRPRVRTAVGAPAFPLKNSNDASATATFSAAAGGDDPASSARGEQQAGSSAGAGNCVTSTSTTRSFTRADMSQPAPAVSSRRGALRLSPRVGTNGMALSPPAVFLGGGGRLAPAMGMGGLTQVRNPSVGRLGFPTTACSPPQQLRGRTTGNMSGSPFFGNLNFSLSPRQAAPRGSGQPATVGPQQLAAIISQDNINKAGSKGVNLNMKDPAQLVDESTTAAKIVSREVLGREKSREVSGEPRDVDEVEAESVSVSGAEPVDDKKNIPSVAASSPEEAGAATTAALKARLNKEQVLPVEPAIKLGLNKEMRKQSTAAAAASVDENKGEMKDSAAAPATTTVVTLEKKSETTSAAATSMARGTGTSMPRRMESSSGVRRQRSTAATTVSAAAASADAAASAAKAANHTDTSTTAVLREVTSGDITSTSTSFGIPALRTGATAAGRWGGVVQQGDPRIGAAAALGGALTKGGAAGEFCPPPRFTSPPLSLRQLSAKSLYRPSCAAPTARPSARIEKGKYPKIGLHFAAAKIQRAYRIFQWRKKFLRHGRHVLGWVGSLDWLQRHNQLYGTELAEEQDIQNWDAAYLTAPVDAEVDPWGNKRLREHLNKMWYGEPEGAP